MIHCCQDWTTSMVFVLIKTKTKCVWSKTWIVWTEICLSCDVHPAEVTRSLSYHAAFRSSWNLATRLRWSDGNTWLGRPFIDHKTSSDRRERLPINFRPSLAKLPPAKEKKTKNNPSYLKKQMIHPEFHVRCSYLLDQRLRCVSGSRRCSRQWLPLQSAGLWLLRHQNLGEYVCRPTPGLTDDW